MASTTRAASKAAKAPAKKAAAKGKDAAPKGTAAKSAAAKNATKSATKNASAANPAAAKASAGKVPAGKAPAKVTAPAKAPAKKAEPAPRARVIPALAKRAPADTRKAPPKRKGPLDKFLLGQLAALEEERTTYTRQAASLKAEADQLAAEREPGDVQFDEESGEGDTLAVERERDLALSAQASAAVDEIDRAIEKLHDGTYGVCEQCYSNIPKERLRALPYAALCVQCKSAGFARR
jgi:DnaK suppressor protein